MSTVALFTSEPFVVDGDRSLLTRSKFDTISLMSEPFDEVIIYSTHKNIGEEKTNYYNLPVKYKCESIGRFDESSKLKRMFRMVKDGLLFFKRTRKVDVVYTRIPMWDAYIPSLMALLLGRKRYVSLHGDIEEALEIALKGKSPLFRNALIFLMGKLTRVIVNNADLLFVSGPELQKKYAPKKKNVVPFLDSGYLAKDIVKGVPKIKQENIIKLLYVGELVERKGIVYLLGAVRELATQGYAVELSLIGTGDSELYKTIAKEYGIAELVNFKGYVPYGPELFEEYRKADIMVLPSIGTEGWSRVIVEANVNGIPVITTEVGSLGHAVREFNNGLVVDKESGAAIAGAIKEIVNDRDLHASLVEGAFQRANKYCVEKELTKIWAAIQGTYPDVVGKPPSDPEKLCPGAKLSLA